MSRRLSGRFVLGRQIGSGGMSTVYLGTDEVLDRPIAIKILRYEFADSEIGARFQREGRTAARLTHQNVVRVYDAGEGDLGGQRVSYIVMEYVSGGDLKKLFRAEGPLPEKTLSRVGADVAAGLVHAHEKGIVHRDVKPQNVLLDEYGQPKLTDFGIARARDSTQATQTGMYLGTALYSSPEQLRGADVTSKSDIYSLGVTLYEASTGAPPFTGLPVEIIGQQLTGSAESPRSMGASISVELESLILSCLDKDPARRPGALELREKLLQAGVATAGHAGHRARSETNRFSERLRAARRTARKAGGAGAVRAARTVSVAGVRVFGKVSGKKLRTSTETSDNRGVAVGAGFPTRIFRNSRSRAALLAGTVLLTLLLVSGVLVAALVPRSDDQPGRQAAAPAGVTENSVSLESTGDGRTSAPQSATPAETTALADARGGSLTDVAAAETVAEMYLAITQQRYAESYEYLSRGYRQNGYPTLEAWVQEHSELRAMRFTETPVARTSGGVATVEGNIEILRPDGTREQQKGTWKLVKEDGRWKMSELQTRKLSP